MRLATVAAVLIALLAAVSSPASAQTTREDCGFVLGFATLHDLIPQVVGECVTNEAHNPANGDTLQRATNGLMVWRKSDNWTAFTNGSPTWVNGPFGVMERANEARFDGTHGIHERDTSLSFTPFSCIPCISWFILRSSAASPAERCL